MSLSPVAAMVSLVVRFVSQPFVLWLSFVGVVAVFAYITCHNLISSGHAKFLSVASERGVTAVEYGLVASLIALAIIVAVKLVGTNLSSLFNYVGGKIVTP
jgi:pilus assembly protein Flp/PilA